MSLYRQNLPQAKGGIFLADGGLETTLVFHDGLDLPCFAAFPLLDTVKGRDTLRGYFARYLQIAAKNGMGFILDTPTWRANTDWGARVGYDQPALDRINREAVAFIDDLRANLANAGKPIVLSGVIGPRGDGYVAGEAMSAAEAEAYHARQAVAFADSRCDMVSAITMTNVPEAIGIARAAKATGMPVVISFTVETDGRLPTGDTIAQAINATDKATGGYPAYYMINCAHPTHFQEHLGQAHPGMGEWIQRIGGVRANASAKSHAELDAATELDPGDPQELAQQYRELRQLLPRANVLGGCCGTDHRHIEHISHSCAA